MRIIVTIAGACLLLALTISLPAGTFAQGGLTTAALNGTVTDNAGQPLPLANVVAIHRPSGTVYGIGTREDGRYNISGLRAGGPYSVSAKLVGYRSQSKENVYLELGQNLRIEFSLVPEAVQLSEVAVTAERSGIISAARTGASTSVGKDILERLPTVRRSFQDFQNVSPQFLGNSAAGRNNRFNNIQIDGANVNDLFGLGSSGTPGGQASTQPISLDALQEFQIVVAPYDVRQSGFTGGGVNAITRSGTNDFSGSAYFYGRNQNQVGLGPTDPRSKVAEFSDLQTGFRVGGPILSDQLFFFVNGELARRRAPSDVVLSGLGQTGSNVSPIPADTARLMQTVLRDKYGYDPGSFDPIAAKRESNKLFARLDFNLSNEHKLTVRHNYVDAFDDNLLRTAASFYFENSNYKFNSTTNQTVAQLTSSLGREFANELIIGYTAVRDSRDYLGAKFPFVRLNYLGSTSNVLAAGPEQYSVANALDQDIIEVTDNFSYFAGANIFTVGTHNEFFKFSNLYIRNPYGYYEFPSVGALNAGRPSRYQYSYSTTTDPRQRAAFSALQYGVYAQVESKMVKDLTLTLGIRLDIPTLPDRPTYNFRVDSTFTARGYDVSTDKVPSGNLLWSPRFGFNWDVTGDKTTQIRGGLGIFTGRIPYVWISNQYGNTGVEFGRVDVTNPTFNFSADPDNQPKPGVTAGLNPVATSEVNLTTSDFKMPQLLRFNAAVDQQLPFDLVGTVEFIYSKTVNDLVYQDINIKGIDSLAFDGRPMYGRYASGTRTTPNKINSRDFTNVLLLSNTSAGYQWGITAQIQRPLAEGLYGSVSYTYGRSKDRNSVLSSQAYSQWRYNPVPGNPNDPPLTYSSFDRPHKIGASLSYRDDFIPGAPTTISVLYVGYSGEPYSYTYSGDINGDGETTNDMMYVPRNAADIILTTNNYGELDAYIENEAYLRENRGKILERNGGRNPFISHVDLHIGQIIPIVGTHEFEVTVDVLNIMNLFDKTQGLERYVANQNSSLLTYQGLDPATQKPRFSFRYPTGGVPSQFSDLNSRWQAQLGVRYSF
jgi:hypothetical protein